MSAADFVGAELFGEIKSFSEKSGWGFITCQDFSEDIFVSFNCAPRLREAAAMVKDLKGQTATFTLEESKNKPGSYEARDAQIEEVVVEASESIEEDDVCEGYEADPSELVGQRIKGTVKSFSSQKRWGFVSCTMFPNDIFLSFNTCPELQDKVAWMGDNFIGKDVILTLEESKSNPGSYEAQKVIVQGMTTAPAVATKGIQFAGKGGKAARPKSAAASVGRMCSGFIKSFAQKNGWGFLSCDSFPDDVFVSFNTCPEMQAICAMYGGANLSNVRVNFMLAASTSTPGRYEAQNVSHGGNGFAAAATIAQAWSTPRSAPRSTPAAIVVSRQSAVVRPVSAPLAGRPNVVARTRSTSNSALVGRLLKGAIKSFAVKNGWGFIECAEVNADIFVSYKTSPSLEAALAGHGSDSLAGTAVSFVLQDNRSKPGQYEASNVEVDRSSYGPVGKGKSSIAASGPYGVSKGNGKGKGKRF